MKSSKKTLFFTSKDKKQKQAVPDSRSNRRDKEMVENLIKNINTKMKDPELAKKAAIIIEEMINDATGNKQNQR